MTLRIIIEAQPNGGVVALHGWLSTAEVKEVEKAVAEMGPSSRVDLAHLTGVDAHGLRALKRLEENGTALIGASHYMALRLGGTATEGRTEAEK